MQKIFLHPSITLFCVIWFSPFIMLCLGSPGMDCINKLGPIIPGLVTDIQGNVYIGNMFVSELMLKFK